MKRFAWTALALGVLTASGFAQSEYLAGYLIIPTGGKVDAQFNAGYSMYVAAWPLLKTYPGHRFQTGLPGTWMFAQYDGEAPKDMYSDVEGGLGWWRDTRFPTETPKFIMGGVGPNFSEIANGPAHGAGNWENPRGLYGVAQLSNRLVFPIDGLNVKQGTMGQLFGWGYLNLPLLEAKSTTEGTDLPTGGNCWTLFLNTENFKGPVAFFTPHFWSHALLKNPELAGKLLDTRPVNPNRQVQMETQYIPCRVAKDSMGDSYARIAPTAFPRNAGAQSLLVHQDTAYNSDALWKSVDSWFRGGPASSGKIDPAGSFQRVFPGKGYATWQIRAKDEDGKEVKIDIDWNEFATPMALDSHSYGYHWEDGVTKAGGRLTWLPEYYHLTKSDKGKDVWKPVAAEAVPAETKLAAIQWTRPKEEPQEPYLTPDDPKSVWITPGPKAGPFKAHLGDGTVVTYYWYRFCDQPAIMKADLNDSEREALQKRVEMIHRSWTIEREYLPGPTRGSLAAVDPAQVVKPPRGLEVGYVPIATSQVLER